MVIFNRIHPSPKKRAQQRTFKMTLFRYINFLFRSLALTLTVLVFGIYLFLLMLVLVLQRLSLYWEILIMLLSQFPWNFCHIKKGLPFLIAQLVSEQVQVGIDVYIPHHKYQVKSHSSSSPCCCHSSQKSLFVCVCVPTE